MSSVPIHSLRASEVFGFLETSSSGLAAAEVVARQSLYGENVLTEQARPPAWRRYLRQVRHPFVLLMLAGAVIGSSQAVADIELARGLFGGVSLTTEQDPEKPNPTFIEAGNRAADHAIQAHGGNGYTKEYMVEKIKRDVRITTIYEGTSEIMEWTIARDRWQLHLKTRGQHYHDAARALEALLAGTVALETVFLLHDVGEQGGMGHPLASGLFEVVVPVVSQAGQSQRTEFFLQVVIHRIGRGWGIR